MTRVVVNSLALIIGLMVVLSCTEKSTESMPKEIGDPDNQSFQYVELEFAHDMPETVEMYWFDILIVKYFELTDDGTRRASHDTILDFSYSIDDITNWVTVSGKIVTVDDTVDASGSMRFIVDGGDYLTPDGDTPLEIITGWEIIADVRRSPNDSSYFVGLIASHMTKTFHFQKDPGEFAVAGDTAWLSLTSIDTLVGLSRDFSLGVCDVNITSSMNARDLLFVFGQTNDCPQSGSSDMSLNIDAMCTRFTTEYSVDGVWTISSRYKGGDSRDVVIENSSFRWEISMGCSDDILGRSAPASERFLPGLVSRTQIKPESP
ncbi:MAG: hypothetical protein IH914_05475 [candidate division Zixibacteria bacterium]|nr:hypothetical protein [candidate division Zixibacteria bacterium]